MATKTRTKDPEGLWGKGLDPDAPVTVSMWTRQIAHQMGVSPAYFRSRYMDDAQRAAEAADPDRLIRPGDPSWTLRRQADYAIEQMDRDYRSKADPDALVDLGWTLSVVEVEGAEADALARIVRYELDQLASRLAGYGLNVTVSQA